MAHQPHPINQAIFLPLAFCNRTASCDHDPPQTTVAERRPARLVGSQGQHRALTLALKAAEAATVAAVRGLEPILLLDDVSSELDPDRTAALFRFLGLARGQIFLTTTRRDLIVTPGVDRNSRRDFRIERGLIEPLPESP